VMTLSVHVAISVSSSIGPEGAMAVPRQGSGGRDDESAAVLANGAPVARGNEDVDVAGAERRRPRLSRLRQPDAGCRPRR
jgi:hypothetical protein